MAGGRVETVKDAAALVKVHPDTLARWLRAGRVAGEQVPRRRRRSAHGGPRWRVPLVPGSHGGWVLVLP